MINTKVRTAIHLTIVSLLVIYLVLYFVTLYEKTFFLRNVRTGMSEQAVIAKLGKPIGTISSTEFEKAWQSTKILSPLQDNQEKIILYGGSPLSTMRMYVYINNDGMVDSVLYSWS